MQVDMETYFFDTHGNLWKTCDPNADGAEAFGPTGAAVQLDVLTERGETPWTTARRMGLVVEGQDGAFDSLVDGGVLAGNGEEPYSMFNPRAGRLS